MKSLFGLMFVLAAFVQGRTFAGEVIAHPSVRLVPGEVRSVYLGEKQIADGLPLVPVDNSAAQDAFLATVLQTNERNYAARWKRKSFREGLRPPAVKGSDVEVMSFVRSTPGAVGYVVGRAGPGVIVIDRF